MKNNKFHSPSGAEYSPEQVISQIIQFMAADDKHQYKIIIGTDSEKIGSRQVDFVTAIVVHRVGNGGRYFWRRNQLPHIATLRDRMWQEAMISIDVAKDFMNLTKHLQLPKFDFEIHIDIGENGKTNVLIQELTGFIRANNFECRVKPHSYAASSVADRHNQRHIINAN